ncbi:PEP-CTERM sorting domain-containing protein [Pelagibius sp. Alg239-R121]|uniref:PEP-CTERM sorting domain-containing protein n=1 Tax=Pelagibius sp. Alg239-R121 TaxID=2993448 RepID=UPI0024A78282|nr:PEP-CTERM sorting domain-containing protein [Pelagibius sp. Alg239-R121]
MMKSFQGLAFAVAGALFVTLPGTAKAVPILIVENGQLLGANNVDVNGTLFDVRFRDGSCITLFSGCDNATEDFAFTDSASAQAAARALRDQVFFDGVEGNFDTSPALSSGCSFVFCDFAIPYELTFSSAVDSFFHQTFKNFNDNIQPDEIVTDVPIPRDFDYTPDITETFAVFTPAGTGVSVTVPEPSSLALLGLGLAGLGFARRKGMWRKG